MFTKLAVDDFFFFSSRRRHTRCSRDWSSDVCSSDLVDYFAAGTLVVWDVDLLGADVVRVYRARERPTVYRRGDVAEAEPAVPGWSMPVDDLFPDPTTSRTAPRAARSPRGGAGRGAPARSRRRRR